MPADRCSSPVLRSSSAARAEGTRFENLIATTTVDGTDWHLGVIHTVPPQMGADVWTDDAAAVGRLAEPFHEENLLLVGDFNAIDQHHTMRELTAGGETRTISRRGEKAMDWDGIRPGRRAHGFPRSHASITRWHPTE